MGRTEFAAPGAHGHIGGWVSGAGPPVVLLHGGPGLSYNYLDPAAEELLGSFRVATFQQRGLPPSTEHGPFTIAQALADIEAVLDHLGWDRAYLAGHSWGGHLAFHAAVSLPHRILGALAIDPLGAVGDGGWKIFEAERDARMSEDDRGRLRNLDERRQGRAETEADAVEGFSYVWPSYFAEPADAPPMPALRWSLPASEELWAEMEQALPSLERALPTVAVPFGVLVGARSPMPPQEAGVDSAGRVPGAWVMTVPDAGHFLWHEKPGCVLDAMRRLAGQDT